LEVEKLEKVAESISELVRVREARLLFARLQHDYHKKCYAIYLDVVWVTSFDAMYPAIRVPEIDSELKKGALRICDPALDVDFRSHSTHLKALIKSR
jgi:hypothetical protein